MYNIINKNVVYEKILAKILSVVANPKKDIDRISSEIAELKKQMEIIKQMPNKVEAIIKLFSVVSLLQDNGGFSQTIYKLQKKNYGQLDTTIEALITLQKHFEKAGRNKNGMNRTDVGETVIAAKVYLGDVFGIWTKPASYWLENKERFEKEDSGANPKEGCGRNFISVWYCINDHQAGSFVRSHVERILKQIAQLKMAI